MRTSWTSSSALTRSRHTITTNLPAGAPRGWPTERPAGQPEMSAEAIAGPGPAGLAWAEVPFVPEVTLLTADQPWELWAASGRDAPPFWAFPWAGGQALARWGLDN